MIPTVLLFWISFFLLMLVYVQNGFPLSRNFDHVVVSVAIDFPVNSKQGVLFHRIVYGYSHANWDGLRGYLRDVLWQDIFKLSASAAASEFCKWVQVGINLYTPSANSWSY